MKITRATFKTFIRKNFDKLYIQVHGSYDSRIDGIDWNSNSTFLPITPTSNCLNCTLGIAGIWLVGNSRDYFQAFDDDKFTGISVSNCCGYFTLAVKKETT